MAAARLSCFARNGRSPGEESLAAAIAVQAIEAQPAFGQIKPMRGTVLACAEQHLETCQLAIGPHKRSCVPGEGRDNLARRKAAPRRRNGPNPTHGRVTAGSKSPVEITHLQQSAREGPRGPRHAEERLPRRSQTNRRWSLRVTCSWPLPPWAAEVGPAQHHFSRSGVPHYRHARPGGTTDGDGTDDGKRLAPPFRGNTDMGKREGHIIAGTCRGKRE